MRPCTDYNCPVGAQVGNHEAGRVEGVLRDDGSVTTLRCTDTLPAPCDHNYQYAGVRYVDNYRPATRDKHRTYFHSYRCSRCMHAYTDVIPDVTRGEYDNTIRVLYGATPAGSDECAALRGDR